MAQHKVKAEEGGSFSSEQSVIRSSVKNYHYLFWKRLTDIIVSLVLIICCVPLFLVLIILILTSTGRPVFFVQTRIGMSNRKFTILKFRTMKESVRLEKRHMYYWKDGVPENFRFKTGNDSSVTGMGRFLRKTSLDELPQLFNVLIGNMSLVGPRPELPEIASQYNRHQLQRLLVKPGITGYAQINGRSEIDHGKKIEYDLFYVENQSLRLDLKIIIETIFVTIKTKGAY